MRNLEFKLTLEGMGIVNFDANDYQKYIFGKMLHSSLKDNIKVGKKYFFVEDEKDKDSEDVYTFKPFIDSNAVRRHLFGHAIDGYLAKHVELFLDQAATWQNIVRGWVVTGQNNETVTRKSAICVTDFLLDGEKMKAPNLVIGTSDSIDPLTSKRSDTSMFYVEKLGDTKWVGHGNININQLMFISASEDAGRMAIKSEYLEKYVECLSNRFGDKFDGKIGYYRTGQSTVPEKGVLFNNVFGDYIIRKTLEAMLSLNITRAQSYAETTKLMVRILNTPFDYESQNEGWIEIRSLSDIASLDFGYLDHQIVDVTKEEYDNYLVKKSELIEHIRAEKKAKEETKKQKAQKKNNKNESEETED